MDDEIFQGILDGLNEVIAVRSGLIENNMITETIHSNYQPSNVERVYALA